MEQNTFIEFRDALAKMMRQNKNLCREGYLDVMRAKDVNALVLVTKKHWAELNRTLWNEFQQCLQTYYATVKDIANAQGLYYNESCDNGVCCVDKYCEGELTFRGSAEVVAHDRANINTYESSRATLLDCSGAIAHDASRIDARHSSTVFAMDFSRIRAFDKATVTSSGATEVYMYGTSLLRNIRSRKAEIGIDAKMIEVTE